MAPLTAHLREPDAHAALPFHPDCPICRHERLVGTFRSGEFAPLRAQAALAASVLALGTTAPAALAAEQDSEHEGASPVAQTGSTDPSQNPNFDPGGNAETLPQAPTGPQNPAPATPGNDDDGPIEQQSATNTNDPVIDNGDGQDKGQPRRPRKRHRPSKHHRPRQHRSPHRWRQTKAPRNRRPRTHLPPRRVRPRQALRPTRHRRLRSPTSRSRRARTKRESEQRPAVRPDRRDIDGTPRAARSTSPFARLSP